ncbi:juvenile hormone esterase-like [Choristoneura fumiferana]|uniref:juvenile hormone esterase-like n=1 Tax=Choristoneura fumiferana TaxID=7141 RepID=UPI003D1555F3
MDESWVFVLLILIVKITCYEVEVRVKQGLIVGTTEASVLEGKRYYAFYGVPYARPPIKKLRFKDPVTPKKWKYPYDARAEFHGACAQPHIVQKHAKYGNEDCLYLNIYTPQLPKADSYNLKPVMVWIHGYAFASSFSHIYGADFLLDNDVLLVTVTHRIGVFGFLKVNETDTHANMGLKDIVMALKWIKRNIDKFNGDKTKVTIMGSGSAATFLSSLLMTKARTLFSKMILQSGALFSPSYFQRSESFELKTLADNLSKRGFKNVLRASTDEIILASQKIFNNIELLNFQRPLIPFMPTIELKSNKSLLTISPEHFFSGRTKLNSSMPLLIGFTSQESIAEVIPFLHNPQYLNMFKQSFKFMVPFSDGCHYDYTSETYERIAMAIKKEYFKDGISEKSLERFVKYTSDLQKYPVYKFIKTLLQLKFSKMFVYKFNYVGKFNTMKANSLAGANLAIKGAASGDELCYILKCEPMWENYVLLRNETSNRDTVLIKQMAKWWTDFAKTGDPTPAGQPNKYYWPATTTKGDSLMLIGKESKLVHFASEEKTYKFWNSIYDKYYKKEACAKVHDEL